MSVFFVLIMIQRFFGDASYAIIGPYLAEVWPSRLRASGIGFSYGIGNLGKIIGPLGLALIVGSSNYVSPKVTLDPLFPGAAVSGFLVRASGPCFRVPRDRDQGPLDRGDRPRARCAGSAGARQGGGNSNLIRRAAGRLPALRRIGPLAQFGGYRRARPSI